ncbi:WcaI family glycosyltransferase [Mycobacterium paraterrae]|uniref:WcaI family glycosyltransferase n=1 Tax=Mycobacterium paraterrae TaxID=577492 RepID=A0ABY3VU39_9MYCO|nr:WcaI family glycosyltransferase [Mycobacterium paraterrae]UMB70712.1 WcaI family glycosyltransferase [Mycobacterium paraterrae]
MKITIVGINYFPEVTGIAPYTTGMAEGLAAQGHDVEVVTGLPHYPEWRIYDGYRSQRSYRETANGVTIHRLKHYVPEKPTPGGRIRMEASFARAVLTTGFGRPSVVIAVSPALLSTAGVVAAARLRGVPVGIVVQDLYGKGVVETGAMHGRSAKLAAQFEGRVLRAASGVSVIHDRFVPVLNEAGVDSGALTVIRNWTHIAASGSPTPADSMEVRRQYGWRPDEVVVVHAGNMGAKQGLENVIAAARLATSELSPGTIRFVLLGDGNQRRVLQQQGSGVGALEFIKPLPDTEFRELLHAADVLLLNEKPGVGDMAVPSKLTTYFTTGKPIVAATDQSSGAATEVRAAGAGVIVAPADPRALIDAALTVARDKANAVRFGEAGKRYAQSTLDRGAAIGRFDAWCHHLADSPSRLVPDR